MFKLNGRLFLHPHLAPPTTSLSFWKKKRVYKCLSVGKVNTKIQRNSIALPVLREPGERWCPPLSHLRQVLTHEWVLVQRFWHLAKFRLHISTSATTPPTYLLSKVHWRTESRAGSRGQARQACVVSQLQEGVPGVQGGWEPFIIHTVPSEKVACPYTAPIDFVPGLDDY